jgi:malonyl-CoA O-methyltransferase
MTTALQSFPRAAAHYDRYAEVQRAMASWLAEWLPTERSGRALEIGSGTGNFTKLAGEWSQGLIATDLATEMCDVAKQTSDNAEWRVMAAEQPLAGPWDWIFSNAMLQWLEDPRTTFRAWHKELAPGGRVLGALFAAGSLSEWRAIAGELDPLQWRAPGEWRAHLEHAGLRVIRDEAQPRVFCHESAREFLRSLHGVGAAPKQRLTATALRKLLNQMDHSQAGQAGVSVTWIFYRFEAERPSEW